MIIKAGVIADNLNPRMWPHLIRLDKAWRERYGVDWRMTSGTDSKHSARRSDHYSGNAVDGGTRPAGYQLEGDYRDEAFDMVKSTLGADWYVKNESNHFHLSYRPEYQE